MTFRQLGFAAMLGSLFVAPAVGASEKPDLFRYGAPAVHSFDDSYFPALVHNTVVIGTVGTKGYDEWQSWGFIEEFKPVLNVGVWHKGADNTYKYSLRAVILGLAPALQVEYVQPAEISAFFETNIGKLEAIEFQYTLPQSRKSCLGFQMFPNENPELYLRGYYCGERSAEPNSQVLVCIMNSFAANAAKSQTPNNECKGKTVYLK